jgi:hypothetical protein
MKVRTYLIAQIKHFLWKQQQEARKDYNQIGRPYRNSSKFRTIFGNQSNTKAL